MEPFRIYAGVEEQDDSLPHLGLVGRLLDEVFHHRIRGVTERDRAPRCRESVRVALLPCDGAGVVIELELRVERVVHAGGSRPLVRVAGF